MVTSGETTGSPVLIHNCRIHTMDEANPVAEAVLIENGRIKEVGSVTELSAYEGAVKVDVQGVTVVPGLVDSHMHLLSYGLSLGEVDLTGAQTIDDVLNLLSRGRTHGGVLRASQLDPECLRENRYPTRTELDSVYEDRAIFVKRRDEHSSVLNSAGFELLSMPPDLPGIEVDPATDQPSGILTRKANQFALETFHGMIEQGEMKEVYVEACWSAAAKGATTVHALVGADEASERRDCETLVAISEELPIRVVPYYQTRDVNRVLRLGLHRIGGCILLDGSIGSKTAAFTADYADDAGNRGYLYFEDKDLESFFESAERSGLQIAVHAIGDRAVEQALRCYENLLGRHGVKDQRHRIEHAELTLDDQFERVAELGICLGMQPAFEDLWGGAGGMYERRLGVERAGKLNSLAKAVSLGICVAGGSDAPITPVDPVYGIHCAVNHPTEKSRLSVKQALEAFTLAGAKIAHKEEEFGVIKPGFSADLVGLSSDPFSVEPDRIRGIDISFVVCRGEFVVNILDAPVKGTAGQGVSDG